MLTTIYKEEDGSISAVKLASETPEEAQALIGVSEQYKPVAEPVDPPVDAADDDSVKPETTVQ